MSEDGVYSCLCQPQFSGSHCQTRIRHTTPIRSAHSIPTFQKRAGPARTPSTARTEALAPRSLPSRAASVRQAGSAIAVNDPASTSSGAAA